MFSAIKKYLDTVGEVAAPELSSAQINLAAAALLVEVMMADHDISSGEVEKIIQLLPDILSIPASECELLLKEAQQQHEEWVSLHQMTRVINEAFNEQQKVDLVQAMWRVAFADRIQDKYEEHLIRKVADLLHLRHKDYIQAKLKAQQP